MPNRTAGSKATVVTAAEIAAQNRVNRLPEDDTQPGNGSELVKADGRSHSDIAYGDLIAIVRHAERQVYDGQTAVKLQAELDNARRQMQRREHVSIEVRQAVLRLARDWVAQDDGGES